MSYRFKLFTALLLVYFIWGSTYLGVHYAIDVLPPMLLTSVRFLVGGSVLLLLTIIGGKSLPRRDEWRGAAFLGVLLSGIGTGSVAFAIKYIPSGLVALLVAMLPLWVFLLDFLFFSKQKPSVLSRTGLLFGLIGIFFLLKPSDEVGQTALPLFPVFLLVLGSISWGYATLISKSVAQPEGLQSIAIQMFAGGVFALVLSLITEANPMVALRNVNAQTFWAMTYLIVIGSYIGYSAFVWLMNNAPPLLTSTYAFVNPVVALFLGWFFAGESLNQTSLIASGIILTGVILMTIGRRRVKAEEE